MTRVVVTKNDQGVIVDARGITIRPLVDQNPVIKVKTNEQNEIVDVDPHVTIVADTQNIVTIGDLDGGEF